MFRHGGTSERDGGVPLAALQCVRHRPSCKAYHKRNSNPWLTMASDSRRATDECAVPPLGLGQSSSHHIAQALRDKVIHVF